MKKLNLNENLISRVWLDKIHYDDLKTTDGKTVEVLQYGELNTDSGADFKNAKVKIGGILFSGDIEIHKSVNDWYLHNHKKDGKYNKVILHVVFWEEDEINGDAPPTVSKSRKVPTVILSKFLNKSIHVIWKDIINNPSPAFKLPCFPQNENIKTEEKRNWIENLSLKRLNYRAGRIKQRLETIEFNEGGRGKKQIWEQVLFEFICEALGFSKNKEQFLKFAKLIDLVNIKSLKLSREEIEALLFITSGLPGNIRYKDEYIKNLQKNRGKLQKKINIQFMVKEEWNFFRLRPQNFPTVRIAYASSLLYEIIYNDFLKKVVSCFDKSKNANKDLIKIFSEIKVSDYWNNHFVFGKESKSKPNNIGESRIKDIIINVLLPIIYFYSERFEVYTLKDKVIGFYLNGIDSNKNEITRVMEKQLKFKIKTISDSQGLIHLHNFYCVKVKCKECAIGKTLFYNDAVSEVLRIILY